MTTDPQSSGRFGQDAPATSLIAKTNFTGIDAMTHLCTGGEAPWLASHDEIYRRFRLDKSAGLAGRQRVLDQVEQCRARIASLWSVSAERVSFFYASADAMNRFAQGLTWQPGDNIVTPSVEFPSVGWAWRDLIGKGVGVRRVQSDGWQLDEDRLLAAVDERTRVVAVSQVNYYTGQALAIDKIADALADEPALLAVDATHASGVINTFAPRADIHMSSCYKWLLGTAGVAPCYISERAEHALGVNQYGWRNIDAPSHRSAAENDARWIAPVAPMPKRYEAGNPAYLPILFLNNALELLLATGIDRIERHTRALSMAVDAMLREIGIAPISPQALSKRSGNTSFVYDQVEGLTRELAKKGILVWGDNGRIRVSTHAYNDSSDIDRLRDALTACLEQSID